MKLTTCVVDLIRSLRGSVISAADLTQLEALELRCCDTGTASLEPIQNLGEYLYMLSTDGIRYGISFEHVIPTRLRATQRCIELARLSRVSDMWGRYEPVLPVIVESPVDDAKISGFVIDGHCRGRLAHHLGERIACMIVYTNRMSEHAAGALRERYPMIPDLPVLDWTDL